MPKAHDHDIIRKPNKKAVIRLKEPIVLRSYEIGPDMTDTKWQRLVENMNEAVWVGDEKERTVYANPKFCELMEYSLEEMLGRPSYDFWTSESIKRVREVNLKERKRGVSSSYEGDLLTKSGKHIPVLLNGTPLPDGGTIGIMTDLTDIRKKEEQVQDLLSRFDVAVRSSRDGLWYAEFPIKGVKSTTNLEKYLWYSPHFKQLLGYSVRQFPSNIKEWMDRVHPNDLKKMVQSVKSYIKSRELFEIECRIRIRSGEYRWFTTRGEVLRGKTSDTFRISGSFRDAHHRKTVENALVASKKLFDDLVEGSPVATFVINTDHNIVYWNKALERVTGLKASDMIGTTDHWKPFYKGKRMMITDMMIKGWSIKEILGNYDDMDVELSSDKKGLVGSVHFTNIRGHGKWLRFMIKPLRDPQSNIVGAIETVEDITERKRLADDLANRTREFKVLYQVNAHTLMAHSLGRVLGDISKDILVAAEFTDFARSNITFDGVSYSTLKKGEKLVCKIEEPILVGGEARGKIQLGYSKKLPHTNGPLLKHEQNLLQMISGTLGKHIRSREIIERYEKLVKKSVTGIFIVNNGKFEFVNPKFCKMFKCKEEMVIGKSLDDLILGCECHQKVVQNNKITSLKCDPRGRRIDGSMIDLELVTQQIDYYGKPATLGTIQDVTRLKQAQEKLKHFNHDLKEKIAEKTKDLQEANRRLKSLNELKDEFIAVTSHELRSPLTAIRGYLSFMVDEPVFSELPETSKDYLMRAYDNVHVLNNLMNNILDVSRIDTNRLELHRTSVNLIPLIQNVIKNLSYQANGKQLHIRFENQIEERQLMMRLDSVRIQQVLRNILENAMKYSKRGKEIRLVLASKGIGIEMSVVDQGVGIPKSQIFNIFDKFKQSKNHNIRYKGGAGLGLFIAKKIVELHDGMIWAESKLRKGTTFRIQLPID